jgi:hypothetical protein
MFLHSRSRNQAKKLRLELQQNVAAPTAPDHQFLERVGKKPELCLSLEKLKHLSCRHVLID